MKTRAVRVGELRLGAIIRWPIDQTLYHRVKGVTRSPHNTAIVNVDGGRSIGFSIDEHVYVLEDEPQPIVLDALQLG